MLFHEVMLTYFLLLYPYARDIVRGPRVDKRIRPDAEFTYGRKRLYIELDTGEESHAQVRGKWNSNYRGVVPGRQFDLLLVVTLSDKRLSNLISNANKVAPFALFTTLEAVRSDPFGLVWTDCNGVRGNMPKPPISSTQ